VVLDALGSVVIVLAVAALSARSDLLIPCNFVLVTALSEDLTVSRRLPHQRLAPFLDIARASLRLEDSFHEERVNAVLRVVPLVPGPVVHGVVVPRVVVAPASVVAPRVVP